MVVTPNAEKVVKVRINKEASIVAYEEQSIRLLDSQYLRYWSVIWLKCMGNGRWLPSCSKLGVEIINATIVTVHTESKQLLLLLSLSPFPV